ncbi:hypothetical protein ACH5RR_005392 [Cinchona calisaya]|uniref:SCP domain-containing protein n=1 Tax=Cinchona calisaya TaxID=153742 RepID=A0ABD3AL15_9GENT
MSKAGVLAGFLFIVALLHGIILPTTEAEVLHFTPRNHLRKRQLPNNITTPLRPFIPTFDWEQQEYVKAHNDLRRTLGVPPLQWDPKLALSAHLWGLQRQKDCNYRAHSVGNNYGENTFWMPYREFTPTTVVRKWFSEQQLFDHTTNRCKCLQETDDCECGHYLNVIWKTTKSVGCSAPIYCAEEKGLLVICHYDPSGNVPGLNPLNPISQ